LLTDTKKVRERRRRSHFPPPSPLPLSNVLKKQPSKIGAPKKQPTKKMKRQQQQLKPSQGWLPLSKPDIRKSS
jgi:hypothetical protein